MNTELPPLADAFSKAHFNKDITALSDLLSDRLEFTTLMGVLGKKDYVDFATAVIAAMPDLSFEIVPLATAPGRATVRFAFRGTHRAVFDLPAPGMKPLPATHKTVAMEPAPLHWEFENGKITRVYAEPGEEGGVVSVLQQMGAKLPPLWIVRTVNRIVRAFKN